VAEVSENVGRPGQGLPRPPQAIESDTLPLVATQNGSRKEGILMKAIVYTQYGSPDVLELKDVEKPSPADDEVLIKVHAASVNAADLHYLRADKYQRIAIKEVGTLS
jgi:hypothetical protein